MLEWGKTSAGETPVLLDGSPIASVRQSRWRERAELTVEGQAWVFAAEGGQRVGTCPDQPGRRFTARRPPVGRSGWELECDAAGYELLTPPLFSSTIDVCRNGEPLGSGRRVRFWSRRPVLEVDPSVPTEHQVFLLWVAFLMYWRQQRAATSSGH